MHGVIVVVHVGQKRPVQIPNMFGQLVAGRVILALEHGLQFIPRDFRGLQIQVAHSRCTRDHTDVE
eukprot:3938567-Rhodomonas_salina.1